MMLARTGEDQAGQSLADVDMMRRCIGLSAAAAKRGEFPFAAIVCQGGKVVVEATNEVAASGDVTRHAEIVAISRAQEKLGRKDLSGCTIYSTVEPCVMCSFPMRETSISRVVFALRSPMMGGFSKWNVLRDEELSGVMPEAFGAPPEIVAGLLGREAAKVWRNWNPLIWSVIRRRGCFGPEPAADSCQRLPAQPAKGGIMLRLLRISRNGGGSASTRRGLPGLAGRLSSILRDAL